MKITIEKFQQLFQVSQIEMDELDKAILLVKILSDKSEFEINKMKASDFNKQCAKIKKAFDVYNSDLLNQKPKNLIKANGKWYFINLDIKDLNSGRYIEISTYLGDIIPNLHKIMASMCVPMKWTIKGLVADKFDATKHQQYADDMLKADFSVAYHCAVFFYAVLMESIKSLITYGSKVDQKTLERLQKILANYMVGYIQPKWLANLKLSL
jgi:hypothetical protein